MVHYNMVSYITWLKDRPQKYYIQTEMYKLYRKNYQLQLFF